MDLNSFFFTKSFLFFSGFFTCLYVCMYVFMLHIYFCLLLFFPSCVWTSPCCFQVLEHTVNLTDMDPQVPKDKWVEHLALLSAAQTQTDSQSISNVFISTIKTTVVDHCAVQTLLKKTNKYKQFWPQYTKERKNTDIGDKSLYSIRTAISPWKNVHF